MTTHLVLQNTRCRLYGAWRQKMRRVAAYDWRHWRWHARRLHYDHEEMVPLLQQAVYEQETFSQCSQPWILKLKPRSACRAARSGECKSGPLWLALRAIWRDEYKSRAVTIGTKNRLALWAKNTHVLVLHLCIEVQFWLRHFCFGDNFCRVHAFHKFIQIKTVMAHGLNRIRVEKSIVFLA